MGIKGLTGNIHTIMKLKLSDFREIAWGIRTKKQLDACQEYRVLKAFSKINTREKFIDLNQKRKNLLVCCTRPKIITLVKARSAENNNKNPFWMPTYEVVVAYPDLRKDEEYFKNYWYQPEKVDGETRYVVALDDLILHWFADMDVVVENFECVSKSLYNELIKVQKEAMKLFERAEKGTGQSQALPKLYSLSFSGMIFDNEIEAVEADSPLEALKRTLKDYFPCFKLKSYESFETPKDFTKASMSLGKNDFAVLIHRYGVSNVKRNYYYLIEVDIKPQCA